MIIKNLRFFTLLGLVVFHVDLSFCTEDSDDDSTPSDLKERYKKVSKIINNDTIDSKFEKSLDDFIKEEDLTKKKEEFAKFVDYFHEKFRSENDYPSLRARAAAHLNMCFIKAFFKEEPKPTLEKSPSSSSSTTALVPVTLPAVKIETVELITHVPTPKQIYDKLTKQTMGQDVPIKQLSALVHRYLRIRNDPSDDLTKAKPSIVLIGQSGCGKTSTLEALGEYLNVPFVIGNMAQVTPQGYIGSKWQKIFSQLFRNARHHVLKNKPSSDQNCSRDEQIKATEKGIVFLDEFDKLAGHGLASSESSFYARVQQELLGVIEGKEIEIDDDKISTKKMLIIIGGAFVGLNPDNPDIIFPHDLLTFGLTQEIVGRLKNIIKFNDITEDVLVKILNESTTSPLILQKSVYTKYYKAQIDIKEDALRVIAKKAIGLGTGARALPSLIDEILKPYEFNIGDYENKTITIDKKTTETTLKGFGAKKQDMAPSGLYS